MGKETAEGARLGTERAGELETETEAGDATEKGVVAIDGFGAGVFDPLWNEDVTTVQVSGGCERAIQGCQCTGVAVAVGGRGFGSAPGSLVDDLLAGDAGRVESGLLLHLGGFRKIVALVAGIGGQDVDDVLVQFWTEADVEVDPAGAAEFVA